MFQFSSSVVEGSILVLPDGGSREDLVTSDALYDYVAEHALEWFRFLERHTEDRTWVLIPNGNLYLVTGLDKAPEWSTLAFQQREGYQRDFTTTYDYSKVPHPWIMANSETWIAHGKHASSECIRHGFNGTVFIRGLRITTSLKIWTKSFPIKISSTHYNIPIASPLRRAPQDRSPKDPGMISRDTMRVVGYLLIFEPRRLRLC